MFSFLLSPMGILFFGGSLLMATTLLQTRGKDKKKESQQRLSSPGKKVERDPHEEKLLELTDLLDKKEEALKKLIRSASETTDQLARMIHHFEETFYAKDSDHPSISMIFGDLRSNLNHEITDLKNQTEKESLSLESLINQRQKAA